MTQENRFLSFNNIFPTMKEEFRMQMLTEERQMWEDGELDDFAQKVVDNLSENGPFSLANTTISAFISSLSLPLLLASLLKIMANECLGDCFGVNPVAQDKIASNMQIIEEEVSDFIDEHPLETFTEAENDELMTKVNEFYFVLEDVINHFEISDRMHIDRSVLGIYDVLEGDIFDGFEPFYLDAAESLSEKLQNAPESSTNAFCSYLLQALKEVDAQFDLNIGDCDDDYRNIINYIAFDIKNLPMENA